MISDLLLDGIKILDDEFQLWAKMAEDLDM